jgi:hypothetical protein
MEIEEMSQILFFLFESVIAWSRDIQKLNWSKRIQKLGDLV